MSEVRVLFTQVSAASSTLGDLPLLGEARLVQASYSEGFGSPGQGQITCAVQEVDSTVASTGNLMAWVQHDGRFVLGGFVQTVSLDADGQFITYGLGGPMSELNRMYMRFSNLGSTTAIPGGQLIYNLFEYYSPTGNALESKIFTGQIDLTAGNSVSIYTDQNPHSSVIGEIETASGVFVAFDQAPNGPYWSVYTFSDSGRSTDTVFDVGNNVSLQGISFDSSEQLTEAYVIRGDNTTESAASNEVAPTIRRQLFQPDTTGNLDATAAESLLIARRNPTLRASLRLDLNTFEFGSVRLGDDVSLLVRDEFAPGFAGSYSMRVSGTQLQYSDSDLLMQVDLVSSDFFA